MQPNSTEMRTLAAAASRALQSGDARGARDQFRQIASSGGADSGVWLGLAVACRQLGDWTEAAPALDKVLAAEPGNLPALLLKGDYFLQGGDSQAAVAFYMSALRAAPPRDKLPPGLQNELARVQQVCADYSKKYEAHLQRALAEHGFDPARSSPRFAQSVDLMLGRKRLYHQQPRHYYFPELPQIQFYGRAPFPWLGAVEAATADIRAELLEILRGPEAFSPYVESFDNRPKVDTSGTADNPDWSAFFLWKGGDLLPENAARCPRTVAALKDLPFCRIAGRAPSVLFSLLRPGAKIPPHNGMINARLIGHLPLIVPEKCGFRVGNDVREWKEGEAFLFDDSIEHEAWNNSDRLRVVMIFDVWKPELSDEERGLVAAMIEAVDAYGTKREWQD
jgi:aspartyl/asparaginyl beta-hydroxylase (cupin superfamily)